MRSVVDLAGFVESNRKPMVIIESFSRKGSFWISSRPQTQTPPTLMNPRAFAFSLCLAVTRVPICPGGVMVVRDGTPLATIVIARDATDQVRAAAATLADYLFQAVSTS
jgi:hypothetical protein